MICHFTKLALALLCIAIIPTQAGAQSGLTSIDYPGGGQIIYGALPGETSLQSGMISMLRNVHRHFGDRPQIGKFYQARGTNSMATFFELTARNPAGRRIRGMILVTASSTKQAVYGAVLSDDAERFGGSWSGMLGKLDSAWHQETAAASPQTTQGAPAADKPRPVPPLHATRFSDGSGVIGIPTGWQLLSSGGGSAAVGGPNGELVGAAIIWQIYDPSNQKGRGLIQYMTNNGRKAMPGRSAISPCCDLIRAWVAAQQTVSRNATFHLISSSRMQGSNGILATGELDNHDGKDPLMTKLQLGMIGSGGSAQSGMFAMTVFRLSAPTRLAPQEMPTLQAIAQSMNQNAQVINHEIGIEIANNNARAEAGREIAGEKAEANYQHTRDVERASDETSKRNQAVDNYILDRTVIEHIDSGAHGTTGYALADTLVTQFPDKFRYVPSQDFIKGVDF